MPMRFIGRGQCGAIFGERCRDGGKILHDALLQRLHCPSVLTVRNVPQVDRCGRAKPQFCDVLAGMSFRIDQHVDRDRAADDDVFERESPRVVGLG